MSKLMKLIQFIKFDIWRIRARKLSRPRSILIRHLRIILLAVRGFGEDKCQLRASALTYYSLLSVVPVLAMAFGIAKGFGIEKLLERQLYEKLPGQEEALAKIIGFANTMLETTKGGLIAGIGVVVLFWAIIQVLGNIESSFNDIWGVQKGRPLGRKFSDYLSIMLICPFLFIMSSSVTVVITSQVKMVMDKISFLGVFGPVIFTGLHLLPYAVIWVLFTFIYIFMPNTKVKWRSGIIGGVIGGTIYQLVQWAYIVFQVGASKYGAIYGSFAALPLFLIWLQTSWRIVLFGAEVSFAEQNEETYEFEPDCLKVSHAFKRLLALQVVQLCARNFVDSAAPWTADQIAQKFDLPIRLLNQVLFELTEAGILAEARLEQGGKEIGYLPARDVSGMTIAAVNELLDQHGINDLPIVRSEQMNKLESHLQHARTVFADSPDNLLLKDL